MDVIDLFCGCGGASEGFRQAGFSIRAGVDADSGAAATFRANFPEATFHEGDVRSLTPEALEAALPRPLCRPMLLSACAPCQPFSRQKRLGSSVDERTDLLDEAGKFVHHWLPEFVFVENVPGIWDRKNGPMRRFVRLLEGIGYKVATGVVDCREFGVPQTRMRFVLMAGLGVDVGFPAPTHGSGCKAYSTVRDWIADFPPVKAGGSHSGVANHRASGLSPANLKRVRATPEGGDRRNWPPDMAPPCHEDHDGHADVYGRLRWDRPSVTLTTRCISLSNGRFGHPSQDRALTVREAASLQTFPRGFVFRGTMDGMARQIGNAVPVALAKAFAERMREVELERSRKDQSLNANDVVELTEAGLPLSSAQ